MFLSDSNKIWLATGETPIYLEPGMANRHGLIAGATGTGKTVTLKVLAEAFSDMGVPVFMADVKGDLSGMCRPGTENKHIRRSIDSMGLGNFQYQSYPVTFWDVYGKKGLNVRTTISEMGPELLSRLLGLNDTQSGILRIIFRIARIFDGLTESSSTPSFKSLGTSVSSDANSPQTPVHIPYLCPFRQVISISLKTAS